MHNPVKHFYDFGPFRLDPERHRLLRNGEPVPLPPKAIEALTVLIKHPGELLEREDLMQAVWADTFVEDANLTVAISQLRKALGQNGDTAEYIGIESTYPAQIASRARVRSSLRLCRHPRSVGRT